MEQQTAPGSAVGIAVLAQGPWTQLTGTAMTSHPISPTYSDGLDHGMPGMKQPNTQEHPYTPPQSIRPTPSAEASLVSAEARKRSAEEANLPLQDSYPDPPLYPSTPLPSYVPVHQVQPVGCPRKTHSEDTC